MPIQQRAPREARPEDVPEILAMVRELAEYERALHEVEATEAQLTAALFGASRHVFSHVIDADEEGEAGSPRALAGFSIWFLNFSTWRGVHGIYLEDLFVRPAYRGRGYGKALMRCIAAECVSKGYARFEWAVLDWNTPALEFYRALGARSLDEWTVHRLTNDALHALGAAPDACRDTAGEAPRAAGS